MQRLIARDERMPILHNTRESVEQGSAGAIAGEKNLPIARRPDRSTIYIIVIKLTE